MNSIDVIAGTVEYRDEGDPSGLPVVLLHGLLMNDAQWSLALPLLPSGFRYLLPVLPMGGHRIPMRPNADLTMPGMIGIVADFLDVLDLTDVTLVITDWGGPLFLTNIGRDKRIGRLVICPSEAFDNFPPGFPGKVSVLATRNTATVYFAMRQLKIGRLRRQWLLFGQMAKQPVPQDIVDSWLAPGLADRRIRHDLVKYGQTKFSRKELIQATNALQDFTGPALVLWSDNPVMPASHGQQLAKLLPNGQLQHVDNAYVLTMLDQPEQTAAQIGKFLTDTDANARKFE
jgi:pimeloyl-ACP methyl ester carboxylesterase